MLFSNNKHIVEATEMFNGTKDAATIVYDGSTGEVWTGVGEWRLRGKEMIALIKKDAGEETSVTSAQVEQTVAYCKAHHLHTMLGAFKAQQQKNATSLVALANEAQPIRPRLFVDMDGVLAEFLPVDTLERLYEKGYFAALKPNENAVDAIKELSKSPEVEVYILSSYLSDSPYALAEKQDWLDQHLPQVPKENRIFLPCGTDKRQFLQSKGVEITVSDFLLDDYTQNLKGWQPPAKGIKLLNGINHTKGTWDGSKVSMFRDPKELAHMLQEAILQDQTLQDTVLRNPKQERSNQPQFTAFQKAEVLREQNAQPSFGITQEEKSQYGKEK